MNNRELLKNQQKLNAEARDVKRKAYLLHRERTKSHDQMRQALQNSTKLIYMYRGQQIKKSYDRTILEHPDNIIIYIEYTVECRIKYDIAVRVLEVKYNMHKEATRQYSYLSHLAGGGFNKKLEPQNDTYIVDVVEDVIKSTYMHLTKQAKKDPKIPLVNFDPTIKPYTISDQLADQHPDNSYYQQGRCYSVVKD